MVSKDARKACQDYLLGYVCYRCGKVKQTNFKALYCYRIFKSTFSFRQSKDSI